MSNEQDHKLKARHNVQFVNTFDLDSSGFRDWSIVGMFYAAIHFVEGYLAQHDIHPKDHEFRQNCVSKTGDLKPLWKDYRALDTGAWRARYRPISFSAPEAKDLKERLESIDQEITTLMQW